MTKHSSIVGGSTAGRLLNCPASYQATLALPPGLDVPSEYAEEGTAMHAVMDALMAARQQGIKPVELHGVARSWVTRTFHDRKLAYEHVDAMIDPALEHLSRLEAHYGGGFDVLAIEAKVRFPRVIGAFGTIDLVLRSATHILFIDWKFGQGVGVAMVYDDGEGAVVNPQITFYIAAAKATHPAWFAGGRAIVGAIVQPRGGEPLTHTEIARKELRQFVEDVEHAVMYAIGRDPPRVRGEWCRFAPCKVACPHWTGPLLDLSALNPVVRPTSVEPKIAPYGEYLARAKALVDSMALLKADIDRQLHTYLEDGGVVPGWRLKAKAKQRQWVDIDTVFTTLRKLGFEEHEIMARKLVTFQQADAAAKAKGVEIPDELRVAPPSTETTIAATDDPAPVVAPAELAAQFSAALRQLTEQKA